MFFHFGTLQPVFFWYWIPCKRRIRFPIRCNTDNSIENLFGKAVLKKYIETLLASISKTINK